MNVLIRIVQLTLLEHIVTYNHGDTPLVHNDYGRHVRRTWVDTHSQSIRTDPLIYLPGEVAAKQKDFDSGDDEDGDEDGDEEEGELADVTCGVKRKARPRTGSDFPRKVTKTTAQSCPSTAAPGVTDDHRPGLTLIDAPVGEDILAHPYGRHGCLYIEVKVDVDEKPNPQQPVSRVFLGVSYY